jgi:hypothetical protein
MSLVEIDQSKKMNYHQHHVEKNIVSKLTLLLHFGYNNTHFGYHEEIIIPDLCPIKF